MVYLPYFLGARCNTACCHVAAALLLTFHLAHHQTNPELGEPDYSSTHRSENVVDIRRGMVPEHVRDQMQGVYYPNP